MASGLFEEARARGAEFGEELIGFHGFRFRVQGSGAVAQHAASDVVRQQFNAERTAEELTFGK